MDTDLYAQPQWLDSKNVTPAKVSNKYLQEFGENPELGISVCTYAATQIRGYVDYIKMHQINEYYYALSI